MISSQTSSNDGVTITAHKKSIYETDTTVSGNKRLTPEPASGFSFYHALDHTHGNEHIMNARRRFELELGGGRKLRHTDTLVKFPDSKQSHNPLKEHARKTTRPTTKSLVSSQDKLCDGPSAPSFPTKDGPKMEVTHVDSVKPTVECHDSFAFEGYDDLQRSERLERLQKRAIELTIEEGIELQRMKCMNILGTSFQTNGLWLHNLQARK